MRILLLLFAATAMGASAIGFSTFAEIARQFKPVLLLIFFLAFFIALVSRLRR